jgi:CheY-like chemotaxis protein
MPSTLKREANESEKSVQTILIVEDEVLVRLPIAEYLRDLGYQVREAANVAEAKLLLDAAAHIDLVFSDVHMPGGEDGLALAQWMARLHPAVPVILTSGRPLPAGAAAGFHTLPKPYNHQTAEALMRSLLPDVSTDGIEKP